MSSQKGQGALWGRALSLSFLNIYLFILFFGCGGSSLLHPGFLKLWGSGAAPCCGVQASRGGFTGCGAQALGTWAWQLRCMDLAAPRHVGSS